MVMNNQTVTTIVTYVFQLRNVDRALSHFTFLIEAG